ncbi:MAG: YigZ family protein [Ignavibacteria bacterium]|nr:YigZ family protein [Ignavibacteria bacterium]
MNNDNVHDSFRTINKNNCTEIKIKKSAFIANSFPVENKDEAEHKISTIRKEHFNARHHPYAYKFGIADDKIKFSDDGEPSGTSGKSILSVIEKFKITNVLVIVTRYFGGVKLGTGGLKRAYFKATELCISRSEIIEKFITKELLIECEYNFINNIIKLIEKYDLKVKDNKSADKVKLFVDARLSLIESFKSDYINITSGKGSIITL